MFILIEYHTITRQIEQSNTVIIKRPVFVLNFRKERYFYRNVNLDWTNNFKTRLSEYFL